MSSLRAVAKKKESDCPHLLTPHLYTYIFFTINFTTPALYFNNQKIRILPPLKIVIMLSNALIISNLSFCNAWSLFLMIFFVINNKNMLKIQDISSELDILLLLLCVEWQGDHSIKALVCQWVSLSVCLFVP